jgi:hypothetical protein
MAARRRLVETVVLLLLVLILGLVGVNRAWDARDHNPGIAIRGWAAWNYSGYEARGTAPGKHNTWDEYNGIMQAMNSLPAGRALWEPSSMEGDPINSYGTSLALELLPYFTKGKIGSMEGLYFESSTTTSIHFLTVAELSKHPSNPVRGLDYGANIARHAVMIAAAKLSYVQHHVDFSRAALYRFDGFGTLYGSGIRA